MAELQKMKMMMMQGCGANGHNGNKSDNEDMPSNTGTVQVAGSAEPIVALVGDDVILPCTLRPTVSAVYQTVEWQRPDLKPKEVHLYRDEKDDLVLQNPSFGGRTSLFKEELEEGNASLKLTRVQLSDAGNYTCYVPLLDHQKTTIQLIVGESTHLLTTQSPLRDRSHEIKGCYPEPVMEWCDVHGRVLPAAGPPETSRDREGCYTVTSHVIVPKTDNNTFTCRVQQPEIKHMKERRVHIPGTLDVSNAEPLMKKNKETTKNEEDEAGELSLSEV
ncbi:unnamed protein product [Coregonus sp. 'balchen']|nr:unnamed protein product [Coregonus sp. 'balchen']